MEYLGCLQDKFIRNAPKKWIQNGLKQEFDITEKAYL